MLQLNAPNWGEVSNIIEDKDVWFNPDPEGFPKGGKEDEPHLTLLYGFHDDVDPNEVMDFVENLITEPVTITFDGISHFANEKNDVVKFDVVSDKLNEINAALRGNFPNTVNFPDYHPHVTIAYVNCGEGGKYDKDSSNEFVLSKPSIKWSDGDDNKLYRDINTIPKKLPTLEEFLNG